MRWRVSERRSYYDMEYLDLALIWAVVLLTVLVVVLTITKGAS